MVKSNRSRRLFRLIAVHLRARKAKRAAFWVKNDLPTAFRHGVQPLEFSPEDGIHGSIYTHEELDEAAREYLAECIKKGRWSRYHPGGASPENQYKGRRVTVKTVREYGEVLKAHHQRLSDRIAEHAAKDLASGHTAAAGKYESARDKEHKAKLALDAFVADKARPSDIGAYAHYITAAVNNDFEFHVGEYNRRMAKSPLTGPCPSFDQIWHLSGHPKINSLRMIYLGLSRCSKRGRRK